VGGGRARLEELGLPQPTELGEDGENKVKLRLDFSAGFFLQRYDSPIGFQSAYMCASVQMSISVHAFACTHAFACARVFVHEHMRALIAADCSYLLHRDHTNR